jgi:signal transduction histidine kinase
MDGLKDHPNWLQVCIQDTGIGLARDNFERIFKIFEQVDGSLNRRYEGAGLGLGLAKRLVELHGGKIWVESEGEGKGCTFCFIVPA